jgi:hypothetical protein
MRPPRHFFIIVGMLLFTIDGAGSGIIPAGGRHERRCPAARRHRTSQGPIKKQDGTMLFNPSYEAAICPGDTVIAVGEVQNLDMLERVLNPCV